MRFLLLFLTFLTISDIGGHELPLKHLDTVNRLSNNKINTLHRDSDGFLWIGTSAGLFRYDGYTFKNYAPADSVNLNSFDYAIESIQEDANGRLWIYSGTRYSVYDPMTDRITANTDSILQTAGIDGTPSDIYIDPGKQVWINVPSSGLYRLDPKWENRQTVKETTLSNSDITDIITVPNQAIAIDNNGVVSFIDTRNLQVTRTDRTIADDIKGKGPFEFTLVYDRDGLCWMFTNERVWLYDIRNDRWINDRLPANGRGHSFKVLLQDHNGKLWLGRDHHGLEEIISDHGNITFRSTPTSSGLESINTITALYDDSEGSLWIGTYKKGLYYHNPSLNKFTLRQFPDVNCITPSRSGDHVWIGTDAEGLIKWNPATDSSTNIFTNDIGAITSIFETADGTLYIGSFSGGLKRYAGGRIEKLVTGTPLDEKYTWSIADGGDGTLWAGTLGGGLYQLDTSTLEATSYTTANSSLTSDYVIKIITDDKGTIFMATSLGINTLNPSNGRMSSLEGLDGISINDIIFDSRGLLWIASSNGLKVYDPHRRTLSNINIRNGESQPNFILGLKEDRHGNIWVAEGGKLLCLNVRYDDKDGSMSYTSHRYDSSDGLQNSDFNQRSFGILPNGEMLVGGLYGINRFRPDKIIHNRHLPRVMFSDIFIGQHRIGIGEKIGGHTPLAASPNRGTTLELSPADQSFTISFASDNYVHPEKTTYQYMLEGLDREWITAQQGINHVTYTNLAPGSYRLLVKAINADGYESASAAVLPIIMHPPFWLTGWAKALYAILIICAIYFIYRLIRRHERRRFNEKRKEDAIKKQEEVNQLKFKFYTNVSHELRTPLTLIVSPLENMLNEATDDGQRKRLTLMRNNAMRLLTLVNQLLDFRKNEVTGLTLHLSEGEMVGFIRNVCHAFAEMSERKNIRLNFTSDCPELNVMFDEDKLYKAIMNLLSNAFKFTPEGGEVTVGISTTASTITINVTDSGIGISDSDKSHIFERFFQTGNVPTDNTMTGNGIGLSMVSEYIQLHNGTIKVTDNPDGGSVFTIELPLIKGSRQQKPKPVVSETVTDLTDTAIPEEINEPATAAIGGKGSMKEEEYTAENIQSDKPIALVVDDSHDMVEFLRDGLSQEFHVISASDGEAAIRLLSSIRPAIILTDLMMPGMDGIELCRQVKADNDLSQIPIIILTAKHDVDAKVEGLTVGADDYITKPFNIDLLVLKMKKLVSLTRHMPGRSLINPEPDSIQITPLDEKMVEKAVKYVVTNIKRPELSVEELSSHLGMSRVHLYKKLKATTGKSPVEFIRLIRLKRGAQMLRESQLNVSEIAYQLGYNNPKYFSKYFKEEFGVLPSVYQNKEEKATNYPV